MNTGYMFGLSHKKNGGRPTNHRGPELHDLSNRVVKFKKYPEVSTTGAADPSGRRIRYFVKIRFRNNYLIKTNCTNISMTGHL